MITEVDSVMQIRPEIAEPRRLTAAEFYQAMFIGEEQVVDLFGNSYFKQPLTSDQITAREIQKLLTRKGKPVLNMSIYIIAGEGDDERVYQLIRSQEHPQWKVCTTVTDLDHKLKTKGIFGNRDIYSAPFSSTLPPNRLLKSDKLVAVKAIYLPETLRPSNPK